MKTRILHIVSSLGMGGAETWLLQLVRCWKELYPEVEFHFLMTSGEEAILDSDMREIGAKTFYYPLKKGSALRFIRDFRNLLRTNHYSVVHDHQDFLSGWHLFFGASVLPKIRVVHVHNPAYQIRENYGVTIGRRLKQKIGQLFISALATHIGGTSIHALSEYGFTHERFRRQWVGPIYCALDIPFQSVDRLSARKRLVREFGLSCAGPIVLFAGRLDSSVEIGHSQNHKNSRFAVDVIRAVREVNANVVMLMAGRNEHVLDEFKAMLKAQGVDENVRLLGLRRDMISLMSGADVLIFPSRAEGLGMVAVEAQSLGLPVLASTAVPKECVVIDELVRFLPLTESTEVWSQTLLNIIENAKTDKLLYDVRWSSSQFNILVCTEKLRSIYGFD